MLNTKIQTVNMLRCLMVVLPCTVFIKSEIFHFSNNEICRGLVTQNNKELVTLRFRED